MCIRRVKYMFEFIRFLHKVLIYPLEVLEAC